MVLIVGIVLPLMIGVFGTLTGLDRDRAFYPVVMIVIALLYVLFAAIGGSGDALLADGAIALAFVVAAVAGFRTSLWIVVAALAAHGVMDLFHGALVVNPGVPTWWPAFCGAYDIGAAGYLAVLVTRRGQVGGSGGQGARWQHRDAFRGGSVHTHSTRRSNVRKTSILAGVLVAALATPGAAQDRDRKYEVGIRSAVILGTMELSGLDPVFADLGYDGVKGPHMSGFFLLYKVRPHLRVGVETLVANSDPDTPTTMNYQAAGPVVELSYGESWFIAGGVQFGGLIVNAMARDGAAPAEGASSGSFYKGSGAFASGYVDVGRRFRRAEIGAFVKPVRVFGESDRGGLSAFNSWFGGLRVPLGL